MPHDNHGEHGNGEDKPFDAVTRLYIRTNPADDGSVPLPGGLAFWTSPDIWIEKPGGALGGEAVPLVQNRVKVTVTNGGGIPAVDAYVDAFVNDPSTGITPATATPIGGAFVTVQAYSTSDVWLPWTPQAGDSGHRCIVARVALFAPPDTFLDGTVFDVVGDRHVAQRNIQVLEVPPGTMMSFRFALGAGGAWARIAAVETTFDMEARALARLGGCAGGLPATTPLAELGVRMLSAREVRTRPTLLPDARLALGVGRAVGKAAAEPELAVRLRPEQPRYGEVSFAASPDEEIGRLHAFDVVHSDDAGFVMGGLSFIVRVVDPSQARKGQ